MILAIAVAISVFLGVVIGAPLLQSINPGIGLWITEVGLIFGLTSGIVYKSGRDPLRYAGLTRPRASLLLFGFALGLLNYFALVVPIQFAAASFFPPWVRDLFDVSRLLRTQKLGQLVLILSAACLAAPFCEEFVFRGIIQRGFMPPAFPPRRAILLTAVIFSIFHVDPVGFFARVELGALFGLLFFRTRSLWPSIAAHAANNAVSSAIFFIAKGQENAPNEQPSWNAILFMSASGLLLLQGVLWLGRRSGIQLFGPDQGEPAG
jgi:membrane protease YdiL (CAAX protease family)